MNEEKAFIKYGERLLVSGWKADAVGLVIIFLLSYGLISLAADILL